MVQREGSVRRRLFNILAILSLLLCGALIVLCVRSYWVGNKMVLLKDAAGEDIWVRQIYDVSLAKGGDQTRVAPLDRDRSGKH